MFSSEEIMSATEKTAVDMIRTNIANSDTWLARGIVAIYNKQTNDEKQSENTKYNNSVGFGAMDAQILSSFAVQCQRWLNGQSKYNAPLSNNQSVIARRLMKKYAGQLLKIAKGNV